MKSIVTTAACGIAILFGIPACSGGASDLPSIVRFSQNAQSTLEAVQKAHTIDFNGLKSGPFKKYSEFGFLVAADANGTWTADLGYGDPAPMIDFSVPADKVVRNGLAVTLSGKPFTFQSVDVYSSLSAVNWKFSGSLKGKAVFSISGQAPNPMGGFASVKNSHGKAVVDRVEISLDNVKTACCGNAVGIDNIALTGQ